MAAGLGYKEFTTGDVLTAADANGYLASQVVMVFADAADRTADLTSPEEGMISYLKDTNAVEKYDGAAWVSVGGGGGGKVLQVVSATTSTSTTIASTSLTDTGLSASITPSLASSKILVIVNQSLASTRSAANTASTLALLRDSTVIYGNTVAYEDQFFVSGATSMAVRTRRDRVYLDSPSTTSAITYKTQGRLETTADSSTLTCQFDSTVSTITLLEIGA
jgi:hypothetical protein